MKKRTPAIPPELDAALRDEPDAAELARVWDLLDEAAPEPPDADDAAWDRLRAATLDASPARHRAADRAPRRSERRRLRILAPALAVVLAVAGWVYLSTPITVTSPAGSFTTVALPDGSTVELNSGSAIDYPRAFWRVPFVAAEARTVRLVGEAYFDVETDGRPFVVETADAHVRVLGTAFNVRTRDGIGTVVTVAEGRVQVDGVPSADAVVLAAGERARVVVGVPTVEATGAAQSLAWRSRGFAAQDVPLAAVLSELERRFAVEITLNAPDAAGDTLTLYFPQPTDAEAILRDVCTARDLRYRRTSRGFEVY